VKYLKYYIFSVAVLFLVIGLVNLFRGMPTEVTIASDKWDCATPETSGITTFCSNYVMKRNAREKLTNVIAR